MRALATVAAVWSGWDGDSQFGEHVIYHQNIISAITRRLQNREVDGDHLEWFAG